MTTTVPRNGRPSTTTVEPEEILFPAGVLGFEGLTRYILVGNESTHPAMALQSVEDTWVAFTLVDPVTIFGHYVIELSAEDRRCLQITDDVEPLVFCILSVPEDPEDMTANLLAPIVINPKARLGKQVILEGSSYSVRQPLFPKPGDAGR